MKKLLFIILILMCLSINTYAQTSEEEQGENLVADYKCIEYKTLYNKPDAACSDICPKVCIDNNQSCLNLGGGNFSCTAPIGNTAVDDDPVITYREINAFGFNWGPPNKAIPAMIRAGFMGFLAIVGGYSVYWGLYAYYLRTTAFDNDDAVASSIKIMRNSFFGFMAVITGLLIAQIFAVMLGLSTDIFSFVIVPRQGDNISDLTVQEIKNGYCLQGQSGTGKDGGSYVCVEGKWQ